MTKKTLQKISIILLITLLAVAAYFLLTKTAHTSQAAYQIPDELRPNNSPFNLEYDYGNAGVFTATTILRIIAGALLYLAAPLAVIAILMAAFNLGMGSGNQEKIETAKKQLTWSVLGLVLIITSYALVSFLITFVFGLFNQVELQPPTDDDLGDLAPLYEEGGEGPVDKPQPFGGDPGELGELYE